jgi:hypothetical protein
MKKFISLGSALMMGIVIGKTKDHHSFMAPLKPDASKLFVEPKELHAVTEKKTELNIDGEKKHQKQHQRRKRMPRKSSKDVKHKAPHVQGYINAWCQNYLTGV